MICWSVKLQIVSTPWSVKFLNGKLRKIYCRARIHKPTSVSARQLSLQWDRRQLALLGGWGAGGGSACRTGGGVKRPDGGWASHRRPVKTSEHTDMHRKMRCRYSFQFVLVSNHGHVGTMPTWLRQYLVKLSDMSWNHNFVSMVVNLLPTDVILVT